MTDKDERELIEILKRSPSYRVAYYDDDFMSEDFNRPVRLQLELLKSEVRLQEEKIISTIATFGSTRILEPAKAKEQVTRLEAQLEQNPTDQEVARKLERARKILKNSKYYDEAREFARLVSAESQNHKSRRFVIMTGGGPGIMEAANRGAHDIGAKSIGLNITLPEEQEPNAYVSNDLCFQFHYFAIRKMHFMLRAKALVAFPGGYGTLDEVFEALTLLQTGKIKDLPVIMFGEDYWKKIINFENLVEEGVLDEKHLTLFKYINTAKEAWHFIKDYYREKGEL